jgi:hypothetical protein
MAVYRIYSYYCDETMERYLLLVQKEYVEHVLRVASRFLQEAVRISDIRLIGATIIVPSEQGEIRYATAYDRYLNLNGLSEVFSEDDMYLLQTTDVAMDVELSQHQVDRIIPSAADTVSLNPRILVANRIYFELDGTNSHTILIPLDIQLYKET